MDGFCGSLGLIASLAIAVLAYTSGRVEDALFALALAGALAAFLGFNLPPARIYLGDAGSMTIGLMISALSVRSCSDGPRTAVLLLPVIALLMLPLLDIVTAVGRRWLKGRSIFAPDREHIHHCLKNRLGSAVATLGAAVLLATLGAGGAVLATTYGMGDPVACLVIAFSVGLLTCTNTFGATESRLLLFRLKVALTSALDRPCCSRKGYRPGVSPPRQPGLGGCLGRPGPRRRGQWSLANRAGDRHDRRGRGLPRPLEFAQGRRKRAALVDRPHPVCRRTWWRE